MEALVNKFGNHEQLGPLVAEAKAEVDKPQPAFGKIRDLIATIKGSVAALKDGMELVNSVEVAAIDCGMEALPPIGF